MTHGAGPVRIEYRPDVPNELTDPLAPSCTRRVTARSPSPRPLRLARVSSGQQGYRGSAGVSRS